MTLSDFVIIKDRVFTDEFCDELVSLFEKYPEYTFQGHSGSGLNEHIKKTTDLNMIDKPHLMEEYGFKVFEGFNGVVEELLESLPFQNKFNTINQVFTQETEYTTCQLQKYDQGLGHYNAYHFETDSYFTTPRIFVFILYLNDVEEGGETEILYEKTLVKPKKGRVICHPATFPFVHNGHTPISGDKYILTTWLAYSEVDD